MSPRRRRHRIVAWGGALACLAVTATLVHYFDPPTDKVVPADALIVLAPQSETRMNAAIELMNGGFAGTLVISTPSVSGTPDLCRAGTVDFPVICFEPEPVTTQGEARGIRKIADQHDWRTLNVLTSKSHISRSRVIIGRCFDGELNMLSDGEKLPPKSWVYRVAYETAALAKVLFNPEC